MTVADKVDGLSAHERLSVVLSAVGEHLHKDRVVAAVGDDSLETGNGAERSFVDSFRHGRKSAFVAESLAGVDLIVHYESFSEVAEDEVRGGFHSEGFEEHLLDDHLGGLVAEDFQHSGSELAGETVLMSCARFEGKRYFGRCSDVVSE